MIATVDNPSNAVEWALAEMIKQPALLERATEELNRVVGRNRLVQKSDLSQLNYVKSCVRESFRLHPIVPFNVPQVSTAISLAISSPKHWEAWLPRGHFGVHNDSHAHG
ncbi:hypothetical protein C3L33_07180, partial [Rhododendron williamsianum]